MVCQIYFGSLNSFLILPKLCGLKITTSAELHTSGPALFRYVKIGC